MKLIENDDSNGPWTSVAGSGLYAFIVTGGTATLEYRADPDADEIDLAEEESAVAVLLPKGQVRAVDPSDTVTAYLLRIHS